MNDVISLKAGGFKLEIKLKRYGGQHLARKIAIEMPTISLSQKKKKKMNTLKFRLFFIYARSLFALPELN